MTMKKKSDKISIISVPMISVAFLLDDVFSRSTFVTDFLFDKSQILVWWILIKANGSDKETGTVGEIRSKKMAIVSNNKTVTDSQAYLE